MSKYSINVYTDNVIIEDIALGSKIAFPRNGYMVNYNNKEVLLLDSDSNYVSQRFRTVADIASITDNRSGLPVVIPIPGDLSTLFTILADYFIVGSPDVTVADAILGDIDLNTDNIENLLQGKLGSEETPAIQNAVSGGTILAGTFSVSFYNKGTTNATVLDAALLPGATIELSAKVGNTLGDMIYVASVDSELQIITTTIV